VIVEYYSEILFRSFSSPPPLLTDKTTVSDFPPSIDAEKNPQEAYLFSSLDPANNGTCKSPPLSSSTEDSPRYVQLFPSPLPHLYTARCMDLEGVNDCCVTFFIKIYETIFSFKKVDPLKALLPFAPEAALPHTVGFFQNVRFFS